MADELVTGRADLERLGWSERFAVHFAPHAAAGRTPARVAVEHRSVYELLTERGEAEASIGGRMRRAAGSRADLPAVGDWVAFSPSSGDGPGIIDAVLPRASLFTRKAAGREHGEQTIAANVDVVFIVTSLNAELSLRRLERYLALAWASGAGPVVVLSKSDRMAETAPLVREVEAVAAGAPVHVTSAKTGHGVDALRAHLLPHRTGALLGSSGVGKSTLINALVGFERQATGAIREGDDKGRHTTTRRELVLLPGGGILIDTPGMRELEPSEAGSFGSFDDIEALAAECAFSNCRHGSEPDCAVSSAVRSGRLSAARLQGYQKLVEARSSWQNRRKLAEAGQKVKSADRALQKQVRKKHR